jgi:hypothetical protein
MTNGQVQEYVASGTNTNGRIVLAHIKSGATGNAIFQKDCITSCKKRFLRKKKCSTTCYDRGFNPAELNVIQNGLIGYAFNQLEAKYFEFQNNVINRPDLLSLNSDLERQATSLGSFNSLKNAGGNLKFIPFTGYGEILMAASLAYDVAKKLFSTSTKTEIVESYTSLGFESYDNIVTMQYYLGVAERNIGSLKSVIVRSLQIPEDKVASFSDYIEFADLVDSSTWTNY